MKRHFHELDGIRGILAVLVLLFHLGLNPLVARLTHGFVLAGRYELAVDFFFVLSGFVLCHVSKGRRPDLKGFIIGRCYRMLPVSVLALGLCLLAPPSEVGVVGLLANLVLLQLFLGLPHLNGVAWSACAELWLPGFLAAGTWLGRDCAKKVLWVCLGLVWVLGGVVLGGHWSGHPHLLDIARAFTGLTAGFLLCMVMPASAEEPTRPSSAIIPGLLLTSVGVIMVFGGKYVFLVYAFPVVAAFTIIGFLRTKTFLSGKVLQFLGARSYSIYMVHWPVVLISTAYFGAQALKGNLLLKLLIVAISIGISDLVHRYVELPFLRLRPKPVVQRD